MNRVDQWQCGFLLSDAKGTVQRRALLDLAQKVSSKPRWCATQRLEEVDGEPNLLPPR